MHCFYLHLIYCRFSESGLQSEANEDDLKHNDDSEFSFMSHILHRPNAGSAEEVNFDEAISQLKDFCSTSDDLRDVNQTNTNDSNGDQIKNKTNVDQTDDCPKRPRLEDNNDNSFETSKDASTHSKTVITVEESAENSSSQARYGQNGSKASQAVATKKAVLSECPFSDCKQTFASKEEFHRHLDEVHNRFKCSDCPQKFPNRELLEKHNKTRHPSKSNPKVIKILPKPTAIRPSVIPPPFVQRIPVLGINLPKISVRPLQTILGTAATNQNVNTTINKAIIINKVPVDVPRAGSQPQNTIKTYSGRSLKVKTILKICSHIPADIDPKDYNCSICGPKPSYGIKASNSIECGVCGLSCSNRDQLEAHLDFFDSRRITLKELICFQCHKIFQGQVLIKEHMTKMHRSG